jgi:DNA-binding transcriptional LysR family regulator
VETGAVRSFVAVARELSFSRAAAGLGLSQPAVSQAVARLERVLGVRLFVRTSREVRLTDEGKVLLPYAEAMLEHVGAFESEAVRLASALGAPITLGYCPLVGGLAARVARRAGVDVDLVRLGWSGATAALAEGQVPIALMPTPFPAGLPSTARFHVPLTHVAVPTAAPLARAARVSAAQLTGVRVLMPAHRPAGGVWSVVAGALRSVFVPADLDDLPAALDLVAAGRGALVAPALLSETVRRPDVRFVRLAFPTATPRLTYGLVWSADRASAEVMAVIQALRDILRTP